MFDKYIYKFLDKVMEWSGKINAWAWVKHLKYIEKRREERYFGKENGRKWDGKSRVSNDTYRKRYDEIFKKEKTVSELLEEGFEEEQAEYLKELEDKL